MPGELSGSDERRALVSNVSSAGAAVSVDDVGQSAQPRILWRRARYQRSIAAVDLLASVLGVLTALAERFGNGMTNLSAPYVAFAVGLPLAWLLCAALNRAYEQRFLGAGTTEFVRVGHAFVQLTAVVAVAAYLTNTDIARSVSVGALLVTLVASVTGRLVCRAVLHSKRRAGRASMPVLAVGTAADIVAFAETLEQNNSAGFRLIGACLSDADGAAELAAHSIPTVVGIDSVGEAVATVGAQTVAVVSSTITGEKLRWIAWQIETSDTDLVVLPGLTEVAGRRLQLQQVGGLPLLYVRQPEFKGAHRVIKGAFDRVGALLLLSLGAPVLLTIALLVRVTSRGPALYFQTRVGKDGRTFRMAKFRSMCVNAESMITDLQDSNESEGQMLFKIKDDPRVTRIGKVLRRLSLDELPQLFNVLTGSMSLVGPRPPLQSEVARYGADAQRRLLVKPGLTGLWQVSGRSDLSWEESVRLDLRYVDNWSLTLDMIVLVKTASAVLRARGAY